MNRGLLAFVGERGALHALRISKHGVMPAGDIQTPTRLQKPVAALARHPRRALLYAALPSVVEAYRVDTDSGRLLYLGSAKAPGEGLCDLDIHSSGRWIAAAASQSGTVSTLGINESGAPVNSIVSWTNSLAGVDKAKPTMGGLFAQQVRFAKDKLYSCDIACDRVFMYDLDVERGTLRREGGKTVDNLEKTGSKNQGPRAIVFHPVYNIAYVLHHNSNTVGICQLDNTTGGLVPLDSVETSSNQALDVNAFGSIQISTDARFLYASNQRGDNIVTMSIEENGRKLTVVSEVSSGGKDPHQFSLSKDGSVMLVANLLSNTVNAFSIDERTGIPSPIDHGKIDIPAPSAVIMFD